MGEQAIKQPVLNVESSEGLEPHRIPSLGLSKRRSG